MSAKPTSEAPRSADDDALATTVDVVQSARDAGRATNPALLANRYELLGLLGSGGMGTVYRARDRELDEVVALKVLSKELAGQPWMIERFRAEVKLARRVTHKNVARTFDIGEHGGARFLTMEYVDGHPLSVEAQGQVSFVRAIAIGRALAAGLGASHDADVVHGDLKPANVICAKDGRIVITDFGIARAVAQQGHDPLGVAGTPAYMAPEQVEGHPDLDGRADLYALGCMLYRLVTGELPFRGPSVIAIAAARLVNPPPDMRARIPDVPAPLASVVLRCMARNRDDRYATAHEVLAALEDARVERPPGAEASVERAAPLQTAARHTSIAVLTLSATSPDDEHLASGLAEDLVDLLSGVPRLRARPSGAGAAVAGRDARSAGRSLGVDAVVDGGVKREGAVLRITLRLLTVKDGFQLWAKRYERAPAEVLTVADEAAAAIAEVLDADGRVAPRSRPTNPAVVDLYLRGRFIYARRYFDVAEAVVLLEAAHDLAPDDVRIAAALAAARIRRCVVESLPNAAFEEAARLAEEVSQKSPRSADARVALGLAFIHREDRAAGARELVRALAIDRHHADGLDWTGRLLLESGRLSAAIVALELARVVEPEATVLGVGLARAHAYAGDWEVAQASLGGSGDRRLHWVTLARLAAWRDDPAWSARLVAELAADADVPQAYARRAAMVLSASRERALSTDHEAFMRGELGPRVQVQRRLFSAQVRAEMLLVGGRVDDARAVIRDELVGSRFCDHAWATYCPLLVKLEGDPVIKRLREQTGASAKACLDAFAAVAEQEPLPADLHSLFEDGTPLTVRF